MNKPCLASVTAMALAGCIDITHKEDDNATA